MTLKSKKLTWNFLRILGKWFPFSPDKIEFENPGNFPLPISELLRKDISLPRNPVIAKLFRNVKLAENAGYGFDKMLKWEKETYKKVAFDNTLAFIFDRAKDAMPNMCTPSFYSMFNEEN